MPQPEDVYEILRDVRDPELGINIVDLGLVYKVDVRPDGKRIDVEFTVTYPGCPATVDIFQAIILTVRRATGIKTVKPHLIWNPPWDPGRMSEAARLELGYPI